ncbi:MAG: nicotinate (nicotinamide) nucleotide adenylyltransferase [Planctomycetes bacterium]|nr:nicotinate (nicotinamide) nucleotide adenylyltransferase [Planctomycetota bacterium]
MLEDKLILFGGTFDPIHLGHTAVAAAAAEQIGAGKVVFIPAKKSVLKNDLPKAGGSERLEMLSLAIADNQKFQLSDYELKKESPSYTFETVKHFQNQYQNKVLIHWLVGADCIDSLSQWHNIKELIKICELCVMFRAGCKRPSFEKLASIWDERIIEKLERNVIETPLIDISSSEIRSRLASRKDASEMLHPSVADYIRKNKCYLHNSG